MNEDEVEAEFQRLKRIYAEKKKHAGGELSSTPTGEAGGYFPQSKSNGNNNGQSPNSGATTYLGRLRTASGDLSGLQAESAPALDDDSKKQRSSRLIDKILGNGDSSTKTSSSRRMASQTNDEMMDHLAAKFAAHD